MPGAGRNERCPCGSGRKVKRCCGQRRGPSSDQLARAHLAALGQDGVEDLSTSLTTHSRSSRKACPTCRASTFPCTSSCQSSSTPELQRLRDAVAEDDPDRGWDELRAVTGQIDAPQQRPPRRDNRPTTRPAPSDPHTGRLRDLRAKYPIAGSHRRQRFPHSRGRRRRQPHAQRPPHRRLENVYLGGSGAVGAAQVSASSRTGPRSP